MPYDSTITFTLDTICPWTYIALTRLLTALSQHRNATPTSAATFHLRFSFFQLYPEAPARGEDKHRWYMHKRYQGSEKLMASYEGYMGALGKSAGINFKFGGLIANTEEALRLVWWVQERSGVGEEAVLRVVRALYRMYFEEERHPSEGETLVKAAVEGGVEEGRVRGFLDGDEGREEVREIVRENRGNGVDAVPVVTIEGRRRDLSFEGAKEVDEYLKGLEKVAKECQ